MGRSLPFRCVLLFNSNVDCCSHNRLLFRFVRLIFAHGISVCVLFFYCYIYANFFYVIHVMQNQIVFKMILIGFSALKGSSLLLSLWQAWCCRLRIGCEPHCCGLLTSDSPTRFEDCATIIMKIIHHRRCLDVTKFQYLNRIKL